MIYKTMLMDLAAPVTYAYNYYQSVSIYQQSLGNNPETSDSVYIPKDADGNPIPLARQVTKGGTDIPLPDPAAEGMPHTVLGGKVSSSGEIYRQAATFGEGTWPLANGYEVPLYEIH